MHPMRPMRPKPTSPRLVRGVGAAAVVGVLTLGTACGSDSSTTAAGSSTTPTTPTTVVTTTAPPATAPPTTEAVALVPGQVTIHDYLFVPPTITVAPGETVTWQNTDDVDHWVLSQDGTTVDSGHIAPGQAFAATLTTPGTYAYYCDIHNAMTGTIVVQ